MQYDILANEMAVLVDQSTALVQAKISKQRSDGLRFYTDIYDPQRMNPQPSC